MARQYRAALFQLSHHGRPRHHVHRHPRASRPAAFSRQAFRFAHSPLGADARPPAPLHRQYRRLDHRRSRPPTLAHLRNDAHPRRSLAPGLRRQRLVHTLGFSRYVHNSGNAFPVPRLSRNRTRPRPRQFKRRTCNRHGIVAPASRRLFAVAVAVESAFEFAVATAFDFVAAGSGPSNRAAVGVVFEFVAASFSWAPLTLLSNLYLFENLCRSRRISRELLNYLQPN